MTAKLIVYLEESPSFECELVNTATIGRSVDNTISVPGNSFVSRQHAIVRKCGVSEYQIMDLGSRNGTFLNGKQVIFPETLRDGAEIRIGNCRIEFHDGGPDLAAEEMPDVTVALPSGSFRNVTVDVAILVCDVRGFSSHSEKLPPPELSRFLGSWFKQAGGLIQASGGVIDKFIGDAILAHWPEANPDEDAIICEHAFSTAKRLRAKAESFIWPDSGDPMKVVAALHYGTVSLSNVGFVAQRDATIMGDAVNTTFRLERMSKELNIATLMSEQFVSQLRGKLADDFVDFGERLLKGKLKPVRLFGLG
ncbi:MAG TPA: adenylate/guanylate cyclase domain-containing protein [Chthoniobacterales bacterium]